MIFLILFSLLAPFFPDRAHASAPPRICSVLLSSDFTEEQLLSQLSEVYSTLMVDHISSGEQAAEVARMLESRDFFSLTDSGNSVLDPVQEGLEQVRQIVEARFPKASPSRARLESAFESVLGSILRERSQGAEQKKKVGVVRSPFVGIDVPTEGLGPASFYPSRDYQLLVADARNNGVWVRRENRAWQRLNAGLELGSKDVVSADGTTLVVLRDEKIIEVWDLINGVFLGGKQILVPPPFSVKLYVSNDAQRILVNGTLFETKDVLLPDSSGLRGRPLSTGFLKDADSQLRYALIGKSINDYQIFDLQSYDKPPPEFFSEYAIIASAFSEDGQKLFLAASTKILRFDSKTGAESGQIDAKVEALMIVPASDGTRALFSDVHRDLYLADFDSKEKPSRIFDAKHPVYVKKFQFALEGRFVVVSGSTPQMTMQSRMQTQIFEVSSRKLLRVLDGALVTKHPGAVDDRILIQTESGELQLWDLNELLGSS